MNRAEYLAFHRQCCDRMITITKAKNNDYTGGSDDPFSNFSGVERAGIASTEQGFLTRMHDKMARIITFVQKGVLLVKDESVEDTLLDLANYCILMAGYIRSKRQRLFRRPEDNISTKPGAINRFDADKGGLSPLGDQLVSDGAYTKALAANITAAKAARVHGPDCPCATCEALAGEPNLSEAMKAVARQPRQDASEDRLEGPSRGP